MHDQDRIAGTLLGMAAGDALGAGYEFQDAPRGDVGMIGGGLGDFAPGEWTDDTSMAICIAQVTAGGEMDVGAIGDEFLTWGRSGPADIGNATAAVLGGARTGADLPAVADRYYRDNPGKAAGNGALMRTAPVALAHLGDDSAIAESARRIASLTHADPLAGDSCVLWCIAIDRAVREGRLDGIHDGLHLIPEDRRAFWSEALEHAQQRSPRSFGGNGYTVTALQAAYAAVVQTTVPDDVPALHLQEALTEAVRIGHDTDTVAAIAGALVGARWGASAMPFRWRRMLHGWPGMRARDLVRLAILTADGGQPTSSGWPVASEMPGTGDPPRLHALPGDDGVLLGNIASLPEAVGQVDAVVSLCRVGRDQIPADIEHHEVWLIDSAETSANGHLRFIIDDTVDAIRTLRGEGKRVLLHCAGGVSRTPTIAAAYLTDLTGMSGTDALTEVAGVTGTRPWNPRFVEALEQVEATR